MEKLLAEFIGTAILILFGNGVVANVILSRTKGNGGNWICIAMGWGLAVAVAVYAVGHISGGHINPAVTASAIINNGMDVMLGLGYMVAQVLGGMAGAFLVYATYRDHYHATEAPAIKEATFCTAPNIRNLPFNFLTEFIGTAVLIFCIAAISAPANMLSPAQSPLLVGILVIAIGLSLGGPTGYAINPARDLGPRLMHAILPIPGKAKSDWVYAWVPIAGPLLGGVFGGWLFNFLNLGANAPQ